jgi:acyl-coenzyme A synthetase/AMP-(fatty) acid ligase
MNRGSCCRRPKTSTGKIQKFVLRDREWTSQDKKISRA